MVWQIQLVMSQVKKEEEKKRKALDWMDSDSDESTRWDADNDDDDEAATADVPVFSCWHCQCLSKTFLHDLAAFLPIGIEAINISMQLDFQLTLWPKLERESHCHRLEL